MVANQAFEMTFVFLGYSWLPPRAMMARSNVTRVSALLKKFLHHAQRHVIALGNLEPSPIASVIRGQNPFAKVYR